MLETTHSTAHVQHNILIYYKAQITESQNYKITEELRFEGISGSYLVHTPYSSKVTYNRLPGTTSRRLLNFNNDEASTSPLGKLCGGSITVTVKKCFLMSRWNLLCLICAQIFHSCVFSYSSPSEQGTIVQNTTKSWV